MQIFIVALILASLCVCIAPMAHPETFKLVEEMKPSSTESVTPQPSGGIVRQGVAGIMQGAQIENPVDTMRRTAEEAAKTVGRNLGQYLRDKYRELKNNELVNRFDESLQISISNLPLSAAERETLIQKIEQAYIDDAENAKYELDQFNFRDLHTLVRKEYSEVVLARTSDGTVDTYDAKGRLKNRWTKQKGLLNGPAITYYPNGEMEFIDFYKDGQKISRRKYDLEGRLVFEQSYTYQPAQVEVITNHVRDEAATVKPEPQMETAGESFSQAAPSVPAEAMETGSLADETAKPVRRIPIL